MMAMNVSVEVAFGGGSNARRVMAKGNSQANWQLVQHQVKLNVKTRKPTVISAKWLNLIDEVCRFPAGGKKYNIKVVETVTATTSKTSNQIISVFKVATHSAPTPDQPNQKGQTLPTGEKLPSAVELNSSNQCGQNESYQEDKKLLTVQQSNGEELFIKVPGSFRELRSLDAVALARLLLIFFSIPFSVQKLMKNPPEEAIPEILLIIVSVLVLVQQMEGINGLAPNLLQDGMQIATNKQFQLLFIGLISLSGTHAAGSIENIDQSWSNAVDGNVWEKGDYFKAAALTLASMTIGGAAAWRMLRRPAIPVDDGLTRSSIPRKSNPLYVIHPPLASEGPYL